MLHELTIETTRAGGLPALAEKFSKHGLPLRDRRWGKLVGAWTSEFGELNRLYCLWEHVSASTRFAEASELHADNAWARYLAEAEELILRRDELMLSVSNRFEGEARGNTLYDLRFYDIEMNKADEFLDHLVEILPVREKYSINMGIWKPRSQRLHQAIHLWAYRDLQQRKEVRAAVAKEADWQAYISKIRPLLVAQRSVLLVPISVSPMQ